MKHLKVVALVVAVLFLSPFFGFWIVAAVGSLLVILPVGAIVVRYPESFGMKRFIRRHGCV